MDASDPVYQEFITYMHLSDALVAQATKDEIVEAARILAMQAAHYARTFGELPIPELEHLLDTASLDVDSVGLLRDGAAICRRTGNADHEPRRGHAAAITGLADSGFSSMGIPARMPT